MLRSKFLWLFLFFYTFLALILGMVFYDNKTIVYGVFIGWYILWIETFVFSTPYRWQFKIKEMAYAIWMIVITVYLFYIKEYVLIAIFYLPVSIHFSLWREEKENKEFTQMVNELKITKDQKQLQWIKHEVKNKEHTEQYQEWLTDIKELETWLSEEEQNKEKTKGC